MGDGLAFGLLSRGVVFERCAPARGASELDDPCDIGARGGSLVVGCIGSVVPRVTRGRWRSRLRFDECVVCQCEFYVTVLYWGLWRAGDCAHCHCALAVL